LKSADEAEKNAADKAPAARLTYPGTKGSNKKRRRKMYKLKKTSRKRFSKLMLALVSPFFNGVSAIKTKGIAGLSMSVLALVLALGTTPVKADVVTDWNRIAQQAVLNAGNSPFVASRSMAIVQASVFDAVNGIERRYQPLHVEPNALPGASRRAAAIQAAYAALLHLFPAQQAALTEARESSLKEITAEAATENSVSIERGIDWGQAVADEIFLWRSTDGFTPAPPPYLGGMLPGEWRPTPPGLLPGAGVQFSYMTPWALSTPSQFRAPGPPALTSMQYAADVNEIKDIGSLTSATRTADQTEIARFWNGITPIDWNRIAVTVSEDKNLTLSANSRLFAQLNVAMADAVIACWETKYHYSFWRPITSIRLADTDGNPDTTADASWTPLLTTPAHPDYPSGHATVSRAAKSVLASYFGDAAGFSMISGVLPGVTRNYSSFSEAVDEAFNARLYGGIHFRSACRDGQTMGAQVGDLVVNTVAQRRFGQQTKSP
jgi:hypothetical protein